MFPANKLSESLKSLGLELMRFKTGTPSRVNRNSIDFSELEEQKGDDKIVPFSFETENPGKNQVVCHINYTNEETHKIIMENLSRSPMYSGKIEGVGPRYCPSLEDKVVRFKDKKRHQFFIEPVGLGTDELYLQGLSSSLPEEIQIKFLKTIKGFENLKVMRTAYAIEYDCINPLELQPTLETKKIGGLFGAGQFNGTSGYEEAAAQGLIAGINAALKVNGEEQLILDRASSYIGTLIDDLVTKGTKEPYRMMTSRSEYRLVLRQDNADERLTPTGFRIGLISNERYQKFLKKEEMIKKEKKRIANVNLAPTLELNKLLVDKGTAEIKTGIKLEELLKRPQLSYDDLAPFDKEREPLPEAVTEQVEISVKYEGYIKRELSKIKEMRRLETKVLPKDIDYRKIVGLRIEAAEKLEKVHPLNIGQASRISGVNPADISVLIIYLEQKKI
jgi:tRNA uridine 5-carboxymethylaminomethyl modification enzyme